MCVDFFCTLSAPGVELYEQKAYIEDWLSDVKDTIQVILDRFSVDGGDLFPSLINSEPPYQAIYSLDGEVSLNLYFYLQVSGLEEALLRIGLLKSLLLNLAHQKGIHPHFEYHQAEN